MFLLLRLCCAALSAYIFSVYMPNPARLLYRLSPYRDCWSEYCEAQWYWYDDLAFKIRIVTIVIWILLWALLEIRSFRRFPQRAPRLLTHLSYGPIATVFFFIVAVLATDFALIQYSRWKIVSYIHSEVSVIEDASLKLHNPDRGWCGNGRSATEYYIYGDTAAWYIDDPDPAIRARSLQASIEVYDWLNHPAAGPATDALKKSLADPDPVVRGIAEKFKGNLLYMGVP
ncbi:MAG TPA: hypothetical protein VJT15_10930 [Pyrinomonadaceae bacterium]|nr:hypothetical protein [Pyrinomonadaceae bacterium]